MREEGEFVRKSLLPFPPFMRDHGSLSSSPDEEKREAFTKQFLHLKLTNIQKEIIKKERARQKLKSLVNFISTSDGQKRSSKLHASSRRSFIHVSELASYSNRGKRVDEMG